MTRIDHPNGGHVFTPVSGSRIKHPSSGHNGKNLDLRRSGRGSQDVHHHDDHQHLDVYKNRGKTPKWMVKIMEHPIKMDDLGGGGG